ncbi:M48 family metalloprotease [Streptomyces sp. NPDC097981]|uniref:M48 family metalloprotease n=1 Tax=Streptomyces sp. NPDC097981 TaxID=3155428 RepID=UPI003320D03E
MHQPPEPAYPPQPAAYPPAPQPPAYPPAPQYPTTTATPVYPPAPQYPTTTATPNYPTAPPQQSPVYPAAPPRPPSTPPAPTGPPPDDLAYAHAPGTRVFYKAKQRTADATAYGQLALLVPNFLVSLLLVLIAAAIMEGLTGIPAWLPALAWIASGALVFHRPSEDLLARRLLRLQRPLPQELAGLTPVWREVTARAGIDGSRYELWIENSDHVNAYAAAGHIVGVTRFALENLPRSQLAAVLAHELGHHTGGHAWSGLLGWWYGLPSRITWRALSGATVFLIRSASLFSVLAAGALVIVVGAVTLATITATYGLPLLLLAMPYFLAAVGRRSELRADAHAAGLGFAQELSQMLHDTMAAEEREKQRVLAETGRASSEPGALARMLSTHPDPRTRLHHLQPYLRPTG